MYLHEDHKTIFIHIPKTGGTALFKTFLRGCRRVGQKHNALSELDHAEKYKDWFIFGVVRNPYHRLTSMYRFYVLHDPYYDGISFINFLKYIQTIDIPYLQVDYLNHTFLKPEVYRYEDLDLRDICEKAGFEYKKPEKIKRFNYLGDYDWKDYHTDETMDYISKVFDPDFIEYGYDKWTL